MKKIFIYFLLLTSFLYSDTTTNIENIQLNKNKLKNGIFNIHLQDFGKKLFQGNFINKNKGVFDKNYQLKIGDIINISFWGTINENKSYVVDKSGNIFIEEIGPIKVEGLNYYELSHKVSKNVKQHSKNTKIYLTINSEQLIQVFVAGNVVNTGLYQGYSNNSLLNFLDLAHGINENGSYRNIKILRNNKTIKIFDLYSFLLKGNNLSFDFHTGDVILVSKKEHFISVFGEVTNKNIFEIEKEEITLYDFLNEFNIFKPNASSISIYRNVEGRVNILQYSLKEDLHKIKIKKYDKIFVSSDNYFNDIVVHIQGDINSKNMLSFKKGTTLKEAMKKINFNNIKEQENIIVFRKSIGKQQDENLKVQLNNLANKFLTNSYTTEEEAKLSVIEKNSIIKFIEKAKKVKHKGVIVFNNQEEYNNFILEDEDVIFIPKISNIVMIQGEVLLPKAQIFSKDLELEDYIEKSGGFSENADIENILIVHLNGSSQKIDCSGILSCNYEPKIGDTIIVFNKGPQHDWQLWKSVFNVTYQVAVSAGVLLTIF